MNTADKEIRSRGADMQVENRPQTRRILGSEILGRSHAHECLWPLTRVKDADGGVCVGAGSIVDKKELTSGREAILEGG